MEPKGRRRIKFSVPAASDCPSASAGERIRRRRPTPAALLRFPDHPSTAAEDVGLSPDEAGSPGLPVGLGQYFCGAPQPDPEDQRPNSTPGTRPRPGAAAAAAVNSGTVREGGGPGSTK